MPQRNRLGELVSGAAGDVGNPVPIRRGRGVEEMIGGAPAPLAEDLSTGPHVDNTTSGQVVQQAATPAPGPPRKVASYRLTTALARRVKIFAAIHDMNDYEVVEQALEAYLARRPSEGPGGEGTDG